MKKFKQNLVLAVFCVVYSINTIASDRNSNIAAVDIGVSCDQHTMEDDKIVMKFSPSQIRPPLCIQKSSIVRGIVVKSTKVFLYSATKTWWLIINFPQSTAFVITSITSINVGRELAVIKNGQIVTSGLIAAPISDPMYSTSLESEAQGKAIELEINHESSKQGSDLAPVSRTRR